MRILSFLSRIIVGFLFIVSGLIKANDTIGFSYKLTEYFEVFGFEWMIPFSLSLAIFICISEIVLGFMVLLGSNIRFVSWSLLLMILFFTFLTFFSAYFGKVTDCGCFGDAVKLSPWESFMKDIILLLLILVIFFDRGNVVSMLNSKTSRKVNIILFLLSSYFIYFTYNHLPIKDFRPYSVGKNIIEGMKSCDELSLPCTEQAAIYIVRDKKNDQLLEMNANDWIDQMERYEYVEATDKIDLLVDGYEPPIHDFSITIDNSDITDSILNAELAYLIISYDIEKSDEDALKRLNNFYLTCEQEGITCIAMSSSNEDLINDIRHMHNIMYPFAFTDETTLKTIIRSNPGIVKIESGTVVSKWHFNDMPNFIE